MNGANSETIGRESSMGGTRVTVGAIVGPITSGHSIEQVLAAYPYLVEADLRRAPSYAGVAS